MRTVLISLTYLFFSQTIYSQSTFLDAIKEKWLHNKEYVLKCADLMPEEKYNFRPTSDVATFKKQLIHMVGNMSWITKDYLMGPGLEHDIKTANPTKEQLIDILNDAFDNAYNALGTMDEKMLSQKVDFFAGEKNVLQMIELMDDHLTLHKGQLVVYLRLNDLAPPRFVGW